MTRLTFACNGASARGRRNVVRLDYLGTSRDRVRLGLPRFVTDLLHLPKTYLDLLELAAYVYAADRSAIRGPLNAVEYHSWARQMDFVVRVREPEFWNSGADLGGLLARGLKWMTGDQEFRFTFRGGHDTPPANLFDSAGVALPSREQPPYVIPFSGGLDSLAGTLDLLENSDRHLVLVSHQSNTRTKKTQDVLVHALREKYGGRLTHYAFECTLAGQRAKEETQRSRSFLYTTIASIIALSYDSTTVHIFENGVTSLNFARRQDLMNARASRTTHPQTLGRLERFFSAFAGQAFTIESPFLWKTKSDIVEIVATYFPELLSSSVSCAATFRHLGQATHCGECFQCIDRRFAAYAAEREDLDHPGLYSVDVLREPFGSGVTKSTSVDYLRQAAFAKKADAAEFEARHLKEVAELLDWIPDAGGDLEVAERVHTLMSRHGAQVHRGLARMRDQAEDVFRKLVEGSLLSVLASREHLKSEVTRLADSLEAILREGLPRMFRRERPKNEPDLNEKLNGLLATHFEELRSEHPVARFACASAVPDHELKHNDLVVEAKYIRSNSPPSRASEGISADLTKYPDRLFIVFVVLDLDNAIVDDRNFVADIEGHRPSRVIVIH